MKEISCINNCAAEAIKKLREETERIKKENEEKKRKEQEEREKKSKGKPAKGMYCLRWKMMSR